MQLVPRPLSLDSLLLDPNNYRFRDLENPPWSPVAEDRFHEPKVQQNAAAILRNTKSFEVTQAKESIKANGLVPLEQIVVRPYEFKDGLYVIVEGNRRVAAIQQLLAEQDSGVVTLPDEGASLKELNVLLLDPRLEENADAIQKLMAIRHVGGIKQWGAYQQAQLILERMSKPNATATSVGAELAMTAVEVGRRYRAAKAYNQMQEDDEYGDLVTPGMHGLFQETFASTEVRNWLEWKDAEGRFTNLDRSRDFYRWISEGSDHSPKVKKVEDIRILRGIVGQPRAVAALRESDVSLDDAKRIADEDKGTDRSNTDVELACRAAFRALDKLTTTQTRNLSQPQITTLENLRDKVKQTLDDFRSLVGSSN